eukprot:COSAG02_NODE_1051_length_14956_cov_3.414216_11_plen_86_part_00
MPSKQPCSLDRPSTLRMTPGIRPLCPVSQCLVHVIKHVGNAKSTSTNDLVGQSDNLALDDDAGSIHTTIGAVRAASHGEDALSVS